MAASCSASLHRTEFAAKASSAIAVSMSRPRQ
jgi:hypothetical protein